MSSPVPLRPMGAVGGSTIYATTPDEYLAACKKRREVTERLCGALRDYLCYDMDLAIAAFENGQAEFAGPSKVPPPDPQYFAEAFEAAQREVEMYQSQLDQLNIAAENLSESMDPAMGDYLRATGRAMVEGSLKRSIAVRDDLQAAMEKASAPEIGGPIEAKEASE